MTAVLVKGCSSLEQGFEVVEEGPDYRIRRCRGDDGRETYNIRIRKTLYEKLARPGVAGLQVQPTLEDARKELARFKREGQAAAAAAAAAQRRSQQSISAARSRKPARTSAVASPGTAFLAHAAPPTQPRHDSCTAAASLGTGLTPLLTGSILNVRHAYNQSSDLDSSSRIQLGRQLAQGGFACVYVGRVLQLGDNPAATAEVAAAAHPDVVVMVYVASVPGCCVVQLQGYASNEHTALAMLQREEAVVRLLATAVLHPADAAGCNSDTQRSQHGFQGSGSSSRGSKGSNSQGGYLQTCLVLEYLPRGPVSNVQGKCPEIVAKTVLRPVLCLLELMHSGELGCRIVHRDIKPDNLLQRIPKSGRGVELVLSDFGCCFIELKPRANHPFVAGMHTCIGTSFFKAPEVASMVGRAAGAGGMGASIDCYAFGVTVTQVLGCLEVQEGMTVEDFQQQLADFVDAPGDHTASAAAREFVGCCCGVGRMRTVAAAYGESARMTPAQLLETAWMRSGS